MRAGWIALLALAGANAQPTAPADPSSLIPVFEQAVADHEKELGPNDPKVARSASDLGLFLKKLGKLREAEAPLRKALRIDRANGDRMLAADQENLASVLAAMDRVPEALQLFRSAAEGSDPAVASRSLTNLAAIDRGNAEAYYRKALESGEVAYGKQDARIAVLLNNLAIELRHRDDNRSAEPLLRRALDIQEPNQAAAASTMINLASLLQDTGRLADAERLDREALRIFERRLGAESKELATACSNLADVLWTKGDRSAAAGLYRRAIAMDEAVFGADRPEVAGDMVNLGSLLRERGDRAGDALLRQALAIYEKTLGADSAEADYVRKKLKKD